MKPGIYYDQHINDYHSDKSWVSSTAIKEAKKSMRHFKSYQEGKQEKKTCFDFGNAFEIALMDKVQRTNNFEEEVFVYDPESRPEPKMTFNSKKNKEWRDTVMKTDKLIINKSGYESLESIPKIVNNVIANNVAYKMLKGNVIFQPSLYWIDNGVQLKTRPDIVKIWKHGDRTVVDIIDIKTTKDASPGKFPKDCANNEYPIQAITQIEGCLRSGLVDAVDNYFWLCIEKDDPFNVQLYDFHSSDWPWIKDTWELIIDDIRKSKKNNTYDGYRTENPESDFGIIKMELPLYYRAGLT